MRDRALQACLTIFSGINCPRKGIKFKIEPLRQIVVITSQTLRQISKYRRFGAGAEPRIFWRRGCKFLVGRPIVQFFCMGKNGLIFFVWWKKWIFFWEGGVTPLPRHFIAPPLMYHPPLPLHCFAPDLERRIPLPIRIQTTKPRKKEEEKREGGRGRKLAWW